MSTDHNLPVRDDQSGQRTAARPSHSLSLQPCSPAVTRSMAEGRAGAAELRGATRHSRWPLTLPPCVPVLLGRPQDGTSPRHPGRGRNQVGVCCFPLGTRRKCCRMGSRELLESKATAVAATGWIRRWSN